MIGLLSFLGWERGASGWKSNNPEEQIVFLGDFIDRGTENEKVISTVRDLIDGGKAHAIMGNHELNAVHFHTRHPETNEPLREHSKKNLEQHEEFLKEYPIGSDKAEEVIAWMRSLPLYREFPGFRVVHACWSAPAIKELEKLTPGAVLSEDQFIYAADKNHPLYALAETITKGPEIELPSGYSFNDKGGHERTAVRLKWWNDRAETWRDMAMSVPDPSQLPTSRLPKEITRASYPQSEKPVFFGHYWLTGEPVLQSENALCLDYSAGMDGPLIAYRFNDEMTGELALTNILTNTDAV